MRGGAEEAPCGVMRSALEIGGEGGFPRLPIHTDVTPWNFKRISAKISHTETPIKDDGGIPGLLSGR